MNKKILIRLIVIMAAIICVLPGCFLEYDSSNLDLSGVWGVPPVNGLFSGTGAGYVDKITVNLTFVDGYIDDVDIKHRESPSIGGKLITRQKDNFIKANTLEIDALTKASAKKTVEGLLEAWEDIKEQIANQGGDSKPCTCDD